MQFNNPLKALTSCISVSFEDFENLKLTLMLTFADLC